MKLFQTLNDIPRNAAGGAGGAAGGQQGGGSGEGTGGQQGSGQGGGQGGQQGGGYSAPDYVPQHMRGASADETTSNVWKAYDGARQQIAQWGAVPKDPTYDIKFDDSIAPMFSKEGLDKVMPVLSKSMHMHGITDKQAPFVGTLVKNLVDAGIIDKPTDPNEQWKAMAGKDFRGSDQERIAAGQKMMADAGTFVKSFENVDGWTPEAISELNLLTATPAGVRALQLLQKGGVQKSVNAGGGGTGGGQVTKESLAARRNDPRNQYNNPKYDPDFAQETERQYKEFYK